MSKTIYYDFDIKYKQISEELKIEDYFIPAVSKDSGCPFHKMQTFYSGAKNYFQDIVTNQIHKFIGNSNEMSKSYLTTGTLKVCPGVSELLKNSFVLRSPCDIIITYNAHREIQVSYSSYPLPMFDISQHPIGQTQLDDGTNLLDNRLFLKFTAPFFMQSPNWIPMTPTWHKNVPWKIASGVVSGMHPPIIFMELPLLENEEYMHLEINSGDPLAYIYFTEKVSKKLKQKNMKLPLRRNFLRSLY